MEDDDNPEVIPRCDNPSKWMKDSQVDHCMSCNGQFSLLFRKHHCRVCGKVFCNSCTSEKIMVTGFNGLQRACFSCYTDLVGITRGEIKFVHKYCNFLKDQAHYFTLAVKLDKDRPKGIIIISKTMIIGVQRETRKLMFKTINLLELTAINFEKSSNILTIIGGKKHPPFSISLETAKATEIVKAIREVHRDLLHGYPSSFALKIDAPSERLLPLDSRIGPIPLASNFARQYVANCQLLGTPPSDSLILHVEDLAYHQKLELNFSDIPGVEDGGISFDLNGMILSLQYNVYFRGLTIKNILRKGVIKSISQIFQTNQFITRLKIIKMKEGVGNLFELGNSLLSHKEHALQEIFIIDTNINDKAIKSISEAIAVFPHSLKTLVLSGCGLSSKLISHLLNEGLQKNMGLSINLEIFDLSNNKFDDESSTHLQNFLLKIAEFSQMRKISLSKCNLNLPTIIRPFNLMKRLVEINLSHNKIDMSSCQILCSVFDSSTSINTILLSGCNISSAYADLIFTSIVSNKHLYNIKLDLSDNPIGDKGISLITNHFTKASNIHSLNLSRTKIGDNSITNLSNSFKHIPDPCLDALYLDDLQASNPQSAKLFAEAISSIPTLKLLSLSGGVSSQFLIPFIEGLKENTTLFELNVSNNKLADQGAVAIASLLRENRHLLSFNCENNKITLSGYQAIFTSFMVNKTLCYFEFPWSDFQFNFSNLPNGKKSILPRLLIKMQNHCYSNQQNGVHPRFTENLDEPLLTIIRPLPEVPKSLIDDTSTIETLPIHQSSEQKNNNNNSSSYHSSYGDYDEKTNGETENYSLYPTYSASSFQSVPLVENPASWNIPPLQYSPPYEISLPEKYEVKSSQKSSNYSDYNQYDTYDDNSKNNVSLSNSNGYSNKNENNSNGYNHYNNYKENNSNNGYNHSSIEVKKENNNKAQQNENNNNIVNQNGENKENNKGNLQKENNQNGIPPPVITPPTPMPPPPPPPNLISPPPPPVLPKSSTDRSQLLSSIQSFSKNKLKNAITIDKSVPLI